MLVVMGLFAVRSTAPNNTTPASPTALSSATTEMAAYSWKSCGTKLDQLKTTKLSVAGSLTGGSKVTITASGNTDLHVPLETGEWQVRITEKGRGWLSTDFGDLMKALKFGDPKNTTFTIAVSLFIPPKQAAGIFDAKFVATDQAKSDYMCLDIKYNSSSVIMPNVIMPNI